MSRGTVEIRDPLHIFVRLDSAEQGVLNSQPFQRLRHIHQLALTYLVYPGGTHRRFEHSLGVMELATRIFDVVTNPLNVEHEQVRSVIPEDPIQLQYWRRVLRMAALCHDLGHLPFSHAAEDELLPDGWDHERISREYVLSGEMRRLWEGMEPPINPEHVSALAVGPSSAGESLGAWRGILNEVITGDVFGADRIDYLLRDSIHTGVAYGRFDHFRLIDTLRILPSAPAGPGGEESETDEAREPTLGIDYGGVQSAEALLLARYFMYSQVYFHRTRRIYDIHLKDFLREWRADYEGQLPTSLDEHLAITDNEVLTAIRAESAGPVSRLQELAIRLTDRRQRFALLYEPGPADLERNADAGIQVAEHATERYGDDAVRVDSYRNVSEAFDFPVLRRDGQVVSSTGVSEVLREVPSARFEYVFIDRQYLEDAREWIENNRDELITAPAREEEGDV